jgi:hypothetical protein
MGGSARWWLFGRAGGWSLRSRMKAETMLAELNRLRKDLDEDQADIEWLTLHHAFCFISYKMADFQKYLNEQAEKGAFDEFE